MSKSPIPLAYDLRPTRTKSRHSWTVAMCVAGVLLGPLAVEAALCSYAQWCEVIGKSTEVNTPIIDTIAKGLQNAHEVFGEQIVPYFHRLAREPMIALPVSAILIVFAMTLLKR